LNFSNAPCGQLEPARICGNQVPKLTLFQFECECQIGVSGIGEGRKFWNKTGVYAAGHACGRDAGFPRKELLTS
jgi:hypothetical protein